MNSFFEFLFHELRFWWVFEGSGLCADSSRFLLNFDATALV